MTNERRGDAVSILVVDDDPELRNLLRHILEAEGYLVLEASDGRMAMARLKESNIALVITDLVMPEVEGIETIRSFRRDYPNLRIIAMSGAFGGDYLRIASLLGAQAVQKPFRAEAMLEHVRKALQ